MNRALLRQALDALESAYPIGATSSSDDQADAAHKKHNDACTAIRAELAKPEPKPETWRSWHDTYGVGYWDTRDEADLNCAQDAAPEPLYTKDQL